MSRRPGLARPLLGEPGSAASLGAWWGALVTEWETAGVRLRGLAGLPAGTAAPLLRAMRQHAPRTILLADTAAMPWPEIASLAGIGLDGVMSSLAWWNWQDRWFEDELAMLREVAPVLAPLSRDVLTSDAAMSRALALCAGRGLGWIAAPGEAEGRAAVLADRLDPSARVVPLTAPRCRRCTCCCAPRRTHAGAGARRSC